MSAITRGRPAPQHEVTLTGMTTEAKPAPHHDAIPDGMPSE